MGLSKLSYYEDNYLLPGTLEEGRVEKNESQFQNVGLYVVHALQLVSREHMSLIYARQALPPVSLSVIMSFPVCVSLSPSSPVQIS